MPTIVTGASSHQDPGSQTSQTSSSQSTTTASTTPLAIPTIVDKKTPIVVFVGPPASGKSMIMVRLSRYLSDNGYAVRPDETFLATPEYREWCREFASKLHTNIALQGTVEFLLVNVYKQGRLVAKLLEAPGEDFYTTDAKKIKEGKNSRIEPYLSSIITNPNPKTYVVLLDLDSQISFRNEGSHRSSYAERYLRDFYPKVKLGRDRVVLLYNKIDRTVYGSLNSCHDMAHAREDAEMYYKTLFETMKTKKLGGFITVDNFVFKTFCTGDFQKAVDNFGREYQTYFPADDVFPHELWYEITRKW